MSTTASIATALAAIGSLSRDNSVRDDDAISRLNHFGAYAIVMLLALAAGAKQYAGIPLLCWTPAHYKKKWYKHYVNNYCWITPLYKVPFSESIPEEVEDRWETLTGFYRWVVVFFIMQALMFKLPRLLWQMAKSQAGVNVEKIVTMTMDTALSDHNERSEQLGHVAEFLHRWAITRRRPLHKGRASFIRNKLDVMWKRSGYFLVILFLAVKFLYLVVSIIQFQVVSAYLDINFWTFGPRALEYPLFSQSVSRHAGSGRWLTEDVFPRVALCDFRLRQMMNVQVNSVQCVLSINIYLEKMYIILWFLLITLMVVNLYSLVVWILDLVTDRKTKHFLDKYAFVITPGKKPKNSEIRSFHKLAKTYLRPDGIFLIKIIASNTTDVLAADLLRQIWLRYRRFRQDRDHESIFPEEEDGGINVESEVI